MSEKKSNKPGKMAGLFVQLKNIFGLNIATVAFGVLLLYMIFTAFLLVTSTHIESYQVTTGPLDVYKRQQPDHLSAASRKR